METADSEPTFAEVDLKDSSGAWSLVRSVLQQTDQTRGIAASKVTKMLHRKRPALVPIFDSKVAAFYGTTARRQWVFWPALQTDMRTCCSQLRDLTSGRLTPDGRPVSALRALDIVVWEHQVTSCGTEG